VIVGTNHGIEQVNNLGRVIKREHPQPRSSIATPVRWWNATTVLSSCLAKNRPASPRPWLFPIRGGKVTALTAQRNGRGPDSGDVDAWRLTSGVYLQAFGPCFAEFIATQSLDGSAHRVTIPGVHYTSNHIITGHGSSLLVEAGNGARPVLCWCGSTRTPRASTGCSAPRRTLSVWSRWYRSADRWADADRADAVRQGLCMLRRCWFVPGGYGPPTEAGSVS
jgi:hypothetical protein